MSSWEPNLIIMHATNKINVASMANFVRMNITSAYWSASIAIPELARQLKYTDRVVQLLETSKVSVITTESF